MEAIMDEKLLSLVVNVASERKEACEWLSLTSQVEEQKYRQYSADLERRRRRKYNTHLEEQKKVAKELDNLQKDRQRFEREKQLRRRKSSSASKAKKHSSKSQEKVKNDFPLHGEALGGSASIAFDPKVESLSRRRRRKAKTEMSKTKKDKAQSTNELLDDESSINFPYLSENEVKKFHQSCKSAGLRAECRRWGAAWLYAKKEQDATPNKDQRWNTLLLNAEKEKMRSLREKWMILKDKQLLNSWINGKTVSASSSEKYSEKKHAGIDAKRIAERENSIIFKEHCENIKAKNTTNKTNSKEKIFTSPFSKVKAVSAWAINKDKNVPSTAEITTQQEKRRVEENRRRANLQVIAEEVTISDTSINAKKRSQPKGQAKAFLPDL